MSRKISLMDFGLSDRENNVNEQIDHDCLHEVYQKGRYIMENNLCYDGSI